MSDKSPRQHSSKASKSLKAKRIDKKTKKAAKRPDA
jgi:hypothetical protein